MTECNITPESHHPDCTCAESISRLRGERDDYNKQYGRVVKKVQKLESDLVLACTTADGMQSEIGPLNVRIRELKAEEPCYCWQHHSECECGKLYDSMKAAIDATLPCLHDAIKWLRSHGYRVGPDFSPAGITVALERAEKEFEEVISTEAGDVCNDRR